MSEHLNSQLNDLRQAQLDQFDQMNQLSQNPSGLDDLVSYSTI